MGYPMEKKRARRRRDLRRKKIAVTWYAWFDPKWHDARTVGINANTNHTCMTCGRHRWIEGPTIAELRKAQDDE